MPPYPSLTWKERPAMVQIHHIEAPLREGAVNEHAGPITGEAAGWSSSSRCRPGRPGSEATTTAAAPRVPAARHVPDRIIQVQQHILATLSGKKMEVPVSEPPGREAGRG